VIAFTSATVAPDAESAIKEAIRKFDVRDADKDRLAARRVK
jgi:hypothetical protein